MSVKLKTVPLSSGGEFTLAQGDLTHEVVDAIVNAANERLMHGGGIAALIVSRGGHTIQAESNAWVREKGPISHDKPAHTSAGVLPCRYVIHAVGPVWGSGDEDNKLASAVSGSLGRADELELESIAFPAISTGIFGFPKERAAVVILQAVHDYFRDHPESGIKDIRLVLYDQATTDIFVNSWEEYHQDK
jgi:O-acetyl-ADP-ribose deacetylase (regulator of RNase III)